MAFTTLQDLRTFHNYHFGKGDVHRCTTWPEIHQRLAKDDDVLLDLLRKVEHAQRQLDRANQDLREVLVGRIWDREADEPETP